MFTGIIEEMGTLKASRKGNESVHLTIEAKKVLENTQIGDSISTNGVCLTVVQMTNETITVDVMHETLKNTNLGLLHEGDSLNLERALMPSSRMGGHFVSGHVDGVGTIESITDDGIAKRFKIKVKEALTGAMIEKGSIAVDGISLTLVGVHKNAFEISLIPHTQDVTTLTLKKVGDTVNIETDMIGKYLEKMLQGKKEVTDTDLRKWGY